MGEYRKSNKKKNRNGNFDAGSEKHAADQPNDRYSKFAVRKPVDPETTKYFTEIANLFESNGVEMEERAMICGNALEETAGKEFQLATDYVISHTLEMLLEGCSVDRLCAFLQGCANDFAYIATDKCGSFVAESAFRSLSFHLQEGEEQSLIEDTVTVLCKVMVEYPGDVMTDCHGSHVLRALIYLCKGMPIVSVKSEGAKPSSMALAERLNFKTPKSDDHASAQIHEGFPDLLKFLISEILSCTEEYMKTSQIDQFCSLVLQAALKVLVGDDDELLKIIPVLLGCKKEDPAEGNYLDSSKAKHVVHLMKETAYSHLMEVILEVAPESLYNEIFTKVFGNSLFELSTHQCGNFVVQALVSHVQQQDHMDLIWEELGHKFKDIIGMGKPGVVASIVAASQRLHAYDQKCCQALVSAVSSTNESSDCVVPRFLFLDGYLFSKDKANWSWPRTLKMHVIGSLILQQVFRYPTAIVQPFITSILSLNSDEVLQTAKDAAGARVFEAFLNSDVSVRLKRRLVSRLQGNFGALAMIMSGSFTVEKCFSISNASIQESIVSELSAVRNELSKTRHGPHLIRKLDVEGFAARPDQWRSRQASKQSAYQEFYDTFGSGETKPARNDDVPPRNDRLPPRNTNFLSDGTKKTQQQEGLKKMREEINESLSLPVPFLSNSGFNRKSQKSEKHGKDHKGKYTGKNDSSAGKSERKRPSGDIPFLSHKKSKT